MLYGFWVKKRAYCFRNGKTRGNKNLCMKWMDVNCMNDWMNSNPALYWIMMNEEEKKKGLKRMEEYLEKKIIFSLQKDQTSYSRDFFIYFFFILYYIFIKPNNFFFIFNLFLCLTIINLNTLTISIPCTNNLISGLLDEFTFHLSL